MICPACRQAADVLRLLVPGNSRTVRDNLTAHAAELHAQCRGRCPCQHRGFPAERRPE